jgi:hypothetical protein
MNGHCVDCPVNSPSSLDRLVHRRLAGPSPKGLFNWFTVGLLVGWIGLFAVIAGSAEQAAPVASDQQFLEQLLD